MFWKDRFVASHERLAARLRPVRLDFRDQHQPTDDFSPSLRIEPKASRASSSDRRLGVPTSFAAPFNEYEPFREKGQAPFPGKENRVEKAIFRLPRFDVPQTMAFSRLRKTLSRLLGLDFGTCPRLYEESGKSRRTGNEFSSDRELHANG